MSSGDRCRADSGAGGEDREIQSCLFGYLWCLRLWFSTYRRKPECAAALVHNDVLPFYQGQGLTVGAILTDNGREFCRAENHPFELYLASNDNEHRRTKVKSPQTNGFIERSNKSVLDEFFRTALRESFYKCVKALQEDLNQWLCPACSTTQSSPAGTYRNPGKRSLDTILDYASSARHDS